MDSRKIAFEDANQFEGHCGLLREYAGNQAHDDVPEDVTIDLVDFYADGAGEHYHTNATEYYFVLEGEGTLELEPIDGTRRTVPVSKHDLIVVPPETWHAGTPKDGTLTILVFSPDTIGEENTVLRHE